jgi:HSP20 family molecular chaperone IbpA
VGDQVPHYDIDRLPFPGVLPFLNSADIQREISTLNSERSIFMSRQSHSIKASSHPTEGTSRIRTKSMRLAQHNGSRGAETPEIFLWAEPGSLFISADLRGIDLDDLQIRVIGTRLIFRGTLRSDLPSGEGAIRQVKDASGTFTHVLELPYRVDTDQAEVQNENGLISIILKKEESRQYSDRSGQSPFTNSMQRFFGENGDSSNNKLKDEITILETLERYLEYHLGKGFARS